MDLRHLSINFSIVLLLISHLLGALSSDLKTYIISVRPPTIAASDTDPSTLEEYHRSFLPRTLSVDHTTKDEEQIVYSYQQSFSGFAARLTTDEVEAMKKKEGFLHAYPDHIVPLMTTRTPDFLGLHPGRGLWKNGTNLGEGIIIGMLDTGITSGHPSFDDAGMPPPPSTWKGTCEPRTFCNNKIIGARSFVAGTTPLDNNGHGTHTSSTAAGAFVQGANLLGQANGTAAGIAPRAHLAIYKVCSSYGCATSNILAGLDAAIKDGVDVISISIGGLNREFQTDAVAVGTLAAVEKGIFASCAAGNAGPDPFTLCNEAPWILTVAAGTVDREIRSRVVLPDGRQFKGVAIYQPSNFSKGPLPLMDGGDCPEEGLGDVKGKIVLCALVPYDGVILETEGAAGVIGVNSANYGETITGAIYALPSCHVSFTAGKEIASYISSRGDNATASLLFDGTVIGESPAPVVAGFSSRGPSYLSQYVMKPDISGPGVNILAAWNSDPAELVPKSGNSFNIESGTSMAAPHLSGVAALLKKAHPDWSPAAIKSAIITTSVVIRRDGNPITNGFSAPATFYEMGAGYVDPSRAADPGLIFDLAADDYARLLCGLNLTDKVVSVITRREVTCGVIGRIAQWDLNYPTISVAIPQVGLSVTVNRTVTNVGPPVVAYNVKVDKVSGVEVTVTPRTLVFRKAKDTRTFSVKFTRTAEGSGNRVEGSLRWVASSQLVVRSAFSVFLP